MAVNRNVGDVFLSLMQMYDELCLVGGEGLEPTGNIRHSLNVCDFRLDFVLLSLLDVSSQRLIFHV
jgi:hypothetical protein